jgi:cobalamin biosynthesis Mg chelatase CobN
MMLVFALGLLGVAGLGMLVAQTDPYGGVSKDSAAAPTSTVTGKIVSKDASELKIETDTRGTMTFHLDSTSELPSSLNVGDRVTVSYTPMDEGGYHAARVVSGSGTGSTPGSQPSKPEPRPEDPNRSSTMSSSSSDERYGSSGTASSRDPYDRNRTASNEESLNREDRSINREDGREMPRTASPLPFLALIGVLSISVGLGLRAALRSQRASDDFRR